MSVLSVIVKTVYQSGSTKASLLMPLTDLYQFILSHSKFLEIFLENSEIAKQNDIGGKCECFFPMFVYGVKTVHEEKTKKIVYPIRFEIVHSKQL